MKETEAAEAQIGRAFYELDERHELDNIRGYLATEDSPKVLMRKIDLACGIYRTSVGGQSLWRRGVVWVMRR